jgi:hypothetical protein
MARSPKWWDALREIPELAHRHTVESKRFIDLADKHVEKTRVKLRQVEDKPIPG